MKEDPDLINEIVACTIVVVLYFFISALVWTYSINEWLFYFNKETSILWWQGGLVGFVPILGYLGIPIAVITWIALMFL